MCSALVSFLGLKNEFIFTCSALVLVHGLKKELYSCVAHFFWFMD